MSDRRVDVRYDFVVAEQRGARAFHPLGLTVKQLRGRDDVAFAVQAMDCVLDLGVHAARVLRNDDAWMRPGLLGHT